MKIVERTLNSLLVIVALSAVFGCAKKDGATSYTVSQSLGLVKAAVQSAGKGTAGSDTTAAAHGAINQEADEHCDSKGRPIKNGAPMSQSDSDYAGRVLYCLLVQDTHSDETVPGAFAQVETFACAIEGQVVFDGVERELDVPINSACFADKMLEEIKSKGITSILLLVRGNMPGQDQPGIWDRSVSFQISPNDPNLGPKDGNHSFTLRVKQDADGVAFAVNSGWAPLEQKDAFSGNLNLSTGELRFESIHQRYNSTAPCDGEGTGCGGWNRHTRILVKGSVGADGQFNDVSDFQGIHSELYKQDAGDYVTLSTLKGGMGKGFLGRGYQSAGGDISLIASYTETIPGGACYKDGQPACVDATGIPIDSSEDLEFAILPGTLVDAFDWSASASAYLQFLTVVPTALPQ